MTELPAYGVPDGAAERRVYASAMAQSFGGTLEVFEPWVEAFGAGVIMTAEECRNGAPPVQCKAVNVPGADAFREMWWLGADLNRRPHDYESCALTS